MNIPWGQVFTIAGGIIAAALILALVGGGLRRA